MPTPGLSLVGFIEDQQQAINHLRLACIPANDNDAALIQLWQDAKARLPAPSGNAGNPDIQEIPAGNEAYVAQLAATAPIQQLGGVLKYVEIDPLLAFQYTVDVTRSNHHCSTLNGGAPSVPELLQIALPLGPANEQIQIFNQPQSILLKARSLNVRQLAQGMFPGQLMGVAFGPSLPYVHVVRYDGRCFLHNGYHRCYGARIAGATHIPCLFRDVNDYDAVGIQKDLSTFQVATMESANPPTVAHFTQGIGIQVQLRAHMRVMTVNWSEYSVPCE